MADRGSTLAPEPLDWIVIAAYVLVLLAVGWHYSRKTSSAEDYLLEGGRAQYVY